MKAPDAVFRAASFRGLEDACAHLKRLAETHVPVRIEDLERLEPVVAEGLLACWLHDPAVAVPVEPFASLLTAMLLRRPLAPWDLHGRRALEAEAFLRELPERHPECLACPCFPACEGWGARTNSCGVWSRIIPVLARAARELAAVRRRGRGAPRLKTGR